MAKFNEILVGRFNRFLQKVLSMKGGPPAPQLATEIGLNIEMFQADDLDYRWTAQIRSFANLLTSPAVAAQLSAARLFNPVTSGVVIVLEKITIAGGGNDVTVTRGPFPGANLAAPVSGANRDARIVGGSAAQLSVSSAAATTGANIWLAGAVATADVILDEHQEIAVVPGDQVTVWGLVVNAQIRATFFWRERVLEESEVT